eukprot:COSAG06_NODE_19319_length_844_cov_0.613423_1_plen_60_part_10
MLVRTGPGEMLAERPLLLFFRFVYRRWASPGLLLLIPFAAPNLCLLQPSLFLGQSAHRRR